VLAGGTPPLSYQWRFNSTNIIGATNDSYSLANVQLTNGGDYSVVVSNTAGTVTSSNAVLRVNRYPIADASATRTLYISCNGSNARPSSTVHARPIPMAIPCNTSGLNKALVCRWPPGHRHRHAAGRQPAD